MTSVLAMLLATTLQLPSEAGDTAAVLSALARELRSQFRHPVAIQLDTGCIWPHSVCLGVGPGWQTKNNDALLDTLLLRLGPIARPGPATVPRCMDYHAGPFNVFVRPPVFLSPRAMIVVTISCGRDRVFFQGERFEFTSAGQVWVLSGRHVVWIT